MPAYYNEIEPYVVQWLHNLVAAGHIAPGVVDSRSVAELVPDDVREATQFHAFTGLGVWSYALRLAGWPDDVRVWTGSCPCQPFSQAGKRAGAADERHLWPEWFRLIRECRPPVIFGEQVASKDGLAWLDDVHTDLESAGYAFGAADLCAAGVGAPHIRQRLYFVAYTREGRRPEFGASRVHAQGQRGDNAPGRGTPDGLGNTGGDRVEQHAGELPGDESQHGRRSADSDHASIFAGATRGFWYPAEWLPCTDGVARPVEPGSSPLVTGTTPRVGRLRAYGNSIVAPLAAEFIRTVMDHLATLET